MRRALAFLLSATLLASASIAAAEIFPRISEPAGAVIARKSGEEVTFVDLAGWRGIDIDQDLLPGDVLRTNAIGHLAILFSDHTQLRLGRNTTLLVKAIGEAADTLLGLESGTIWGRAEKGGDGVVIETPAAAAAIRGTDWSLSVDGTGRTSLIVLEGLVDLSNEFGQVSVAAGEAAVASIGQAPTKVVIVDPKDREQMLFHLSLRSTFTAMPASPAPAGDQRQLHARLAAIAPANRSADDNVSLAETSLSMAGPQAALEAVANARSQRLTRQQEARLDIVEALVAGARQDYTRAADLYRRALPHLDQRRRAIASYGGYFARALADPDRIEGQPRPRDGGPAAALAEAWIAGFLYDIPAALEVIRRAEARYPSDAELPAARAQLALLLDDRDEVRAAIARALELDPDSPDALEARALFRLGIESDLEGALADINRAVELRPGSSTHWNHLALIQSARGAEREAEAAWRRAVELDPNDPVARGNLAIFLLDQHRLEEARQQIDTALALDPTFDIGLVARGRLELQTGNRAKAVQDLLAGTTANPSYAAALLLLGAAHYESGDLEAAEQAMTNADRMDPNDAVAASFATAVAIDAYEADAAIDSAREAIKRARARGGDFAAIGANRQEGSTLNDAYRLKSLDAWGRYYGAAVFDPFSAAGHVDQAVAGSANPYFTDFRPSVAPTEPTLNAAGFSTFFRGLMLDPELISGRSRSANLVRRPFIEGSLTGGGVNESEWGWNGEAEVQSFAVDPWPWSLYAKFAMNDVEAARSFAAPGLTAPNVEYRFVDESMNGTAFLTARPTPIDTFVAYADLQRNEDGLLDAVIVPWPATPPILGVAYDRNIDARSGTAGVAWSHTFGYRNVASVAVFASALDQTSNEDATLLLDLGVPVIGTTISEAQSSQTSYLAAASHTLGVDDWTFRYGAEGGAVSFDRTSTRTDLIPGFPPTVDVTTSAGDFTLLRAHFDALYEVTPNLEVEGALHGTILEGTFDVARIEPRVGVAWTPFEGHRLSAGYLRETSAANATTLAPIGIVGLQSLQAPLDVGGYSDTFAARWDAEWSSLLFTTLDYQHQELRDLAIPIPASVTTIDFDSGRLDRLAGTINVNLPHGFGGFGSIAYTKSMSTTAGPGFGLGLPFVPELAGRVGLTWVHPWNIKTTVAATYVGPRRSDVVGEDLGGYWTLDAALQWESSDKRFAIDVGAYNLLDETFEVRPDVVGWGRTFTASLKARF